MILYAWDNCIKCETAMKLLQLHGRPYVLVTIDREKPGPLIEEFPHIKVLPFAFDGREIKSVTRLSRHLLGL